MHQYKTSVVNPKALLPNPWNTNSVSAENEAKLEASIKRLGMFKPVVVRELLDGSLQILGGEHRCRAALNLGLKEVPIINLGKISDNKAKEIGLVDNGRFGEDDAISLAELLNSLETDSGELSSFMPYSQTDFDNIFKSVNVDIDELDLPEDDEGISLPKSKPAQSYQVMRFKVPMDDVDNIADIIEQTMKEQGFTKDDSLSNAGNALVHLLSNRDK